VALVPASVEPSLPEGIIAVRIDHPPDPLETALIWRTDDSSAAIAAFRDAAGSMLAVDASVPKGESQ
jgi:DNA-binding transcriptional LysR family regulator